jgi:hypothetical protein
MMWAFELYRILTAQLIAEASFEAEGSRVAAQTRARRHPGCAAQARPLSRVAKVLPRRPMRAPGWPGDCPISLSGPNVPYDGMKV